MQTVRRPRAPKWPRQTLLIFAAVASPSASEERAPAEGESTAISKTRH